MNLPNGYPLQNGKYRLTHVVGQGGFGITYKGVWYTEVKGPLGTIKTEVPICVKEYFFKDYCYRDPDSFAVKVHSETGRALFEKFKENQLLLLLLTKTRLRELLKQNLNLNRRKRVPAFDRTHRKRRLLNRKRLRNRPIL